MKRSRMISFGPVILGIFLLLLAVGCDQKSPLEGNQPRLKTLEFIELEEGGEPFTKFITTTETVVPDSGGMVELEYKPGSKKEVKMSFKVLPNSITNAADICLGLDTKIVGGMVDMTFGPHGLTFNPYANLSLKAKGLKKMDDIIPDSLGFYYVDSNDNLIKMNCDSIVVNYEEKSIKVVGAKVPHFSRYAIAISR